MISMEDLREVNSEYRYQETELKDYPIDPDQITARIIERVEAFKIASSNYKDGVGKPIYVYDRLIKLTAEIYRVFNIFQEVFHG